jgi:hypothetical protein
MGRYAATVALVLMMGASPVHAQKGMFVVTSMSADIHKAPSTGSAVIGKAPRGKAFEVRRELGSWVAVAWPEGDAGMGYLHMTWGRMSDWTAAQTSRASDATSTVVHSTAVSAVMRSTPESDAAATTTPLGQTPGTRAVSGPAPSLPSHVIGLGGRIGTQALGFAATGRAWTERRIGAQLELGKSTYTTAFGGAQLSAMQFAPSVIYSPRNLVTNAVWTRPYVGGGVNFYRSTFSSAPGFPGVVDSGVGSQMFGGAELTWANLPQVALSADLRHLWAPTSNGFELGGMGFSVSGHWYVK